MENLYNDELLPENFEQMAKAYSQNLKNKGFVFIRLEEEEFNLLLSEIFVLFAKMKACLNHLDKFLDSTMLKTQIDNAQSLLCKKFGNKKSHKFKCVEDKNLTFLSLVSIENMLTIKLMLLSIKSGEFELCNQIITSICVVFAESFSCEGFALA